VVSFEHTLGHYHSVSLKTGGNFLKRKECGEAGFVDGLKSVELGYSGSDADLNFWGDRPNLDRFFLRIRDQYLQLCGSGQESILRI
jgi:hypothetical protein